MCFDNIGSQKYEGRTMEAHRKRTSNIEGEIGMIYNTDKTGASNILSGSVGQRLLQNLKRDFAPKMYMATTIET